MPGLPGIGANRISGIALGQNVETIFVTLPVTVVPRDFENVMLWAMLCVQPGATTTGLNFRIRRGATITDTLVLDTGVIAAGFTAGSVSVHHVSFFDTVLGFATVQYCVTVLTTGATAAGNLFTGSLSAIFLN